MKSGQSCQTTYMMRVEGSERRPFIFIFRLSIALHDLYQVDEVVIEIEEWKQKVPGNSIKKQSFIK